jgi:hypothetical protein
MSASQAAGRVPPPPDGPSGPLGGRPGPDRADGVHAKRAKRGRSASLFGVGQAPKVAPSTGRPARSARPTSNMRSSGPSRTDAPANDDDDPHSIGVESFESDGRVTYSDDTNKRRQSDGVTASTEASHTRGSQTVSGQARASCTPSLSSSSSSSLARFKSESDKQRDQQVDFEDKQQDEAEATSQDICSRRDQQQQQQARIEPASSSGRFRLGASKESLLPTSDRLRDRRARRTNSTRQRRQATAEAPTGEPQTDAPRGVRAHSAAANGQQQQRQRAGRDEWRQSASSNRDVAGQNCDPFSWTRERSSSITSDYCSNSSPSQNSTPILGAQKQRLIKQASCNRVQSCRLSEAGEEAESGPDSAQDQQRATSRTIIYENPLFASEPLAAAAECKQEEPVGAPHRTTMAPTEGGAGKRANQRTNSDNSGHDR